MELRQLKYFATIAKEKQFVRAAEKLFVSQSALSQQIQLLEKELNTELFDKQKRKISRQVVLTPVGEVFLKDVLKILDLSDKAIKKVASFGKEEKTITLGIYRLLHQHRIIDNLEYLSKNLPNTQIKMEEFETPFEVQQAILNNEIDYGITVSPLISDKLKSIFDQNSELMILINNTHNLNKLEKIKLSKLKTENWIEVNPKFHPFYEQIEAYCEKAGFVRHDHIVQEVSSLELMCHFVSQGKGIALIPSFFDIAKFPNLEKKHIEATDLEFMQCLVCKI